MHYIFVLVQPYITPKYHYSTSLGVSVPLSYCTTPVCYNNRTKQIYSNHWNKNGQSQDKGPYQE